MVRSARQYKDRAKTWLIGLCFCADSNRGYLPCPLECKFGASLKDGFFVNILEVVGGSVY